MIDINSNSQNSPDVLMAQDATQLPIAPSCFHQFPPTRPPPTDTTPTTHHTHTQHHHHITTNKTTWRKGHEGTRRSEKRKRFEDIDPYTQQPNGERLQTGHILSKARGNLKNRWGYNTQQGCNGAGMGECKINKDTHNLCYVIVPGSGVCGSTTHKRVDHFKFSN